MNKMIHAKSFNDQNIMLWIYLLFLLGRNTTNDRTKTEVDIQTINVVGENEMGQPKFNVFQSPERPFWT